MGCHALLQGIFPNQGSNPAVLHCRQSLYRLSHQGSPTKCFAAAVKSLQSCPTLYDPIDSSPPGSSVLGFSRQEHRSGLPFPSPIKCFTYVQLHLILQVTSEEVMTASILWEKPELWQVAELIQGHREASCRRHLSPSPTLSAPDMLSPRFTLLTCLMGMTITRIKTTHSHSVSRQTLQTMEAGEYTPPPSKPLCSLLLGTHRI